MKTKHTYPLSFHLLYLMMYIDMSYCPSNI